MTAQKRYHFGYVNRLSQPSLVVFRRRISSPVGKHFGDGWFGNLGYESTSSKGSSPGDVGAGISYVNIGSTNATSLDAGYASTCALLTDGTLKCWGKNDTGQLGRGLTLSI